ncbi:hypothetical protein [Blastococcus goldschmidtiae]|uniref:Uncharacterized protein n=1 Tax=Blastococcus goldschmidtiae TaxID=3075546 RepID=A0ABU2K4S5_9ACTN|nr:hypothetical protein [Blastococcus sp. DSM 46792]MDT0275188.1 hypothetical protein [Blastococcus sp. DSM 46792]
MSSTVTPMSPERHRAVRALLVAEAGRTSQPVAFVRRPVVRRTGFALVATAAAVSATVLATGDPSAPPDYGSWTALPETGPGLAPPPSGDIEMWASQCTDLTGGGVGIEGVTPDPDAAAEREVLVDRRGDYIFCLDLSPGSGTETDPLVAVTGIRSDGDSVQQGGATVYDRPVLLPAGEDVLLLRAPGEGEPVGDVLSAYGAAGSDVTGVELRLTDGTRITATVQSGLWAAWWPATVSTARLAELVVTGADGERLVDPDSVSLDWDRSGSPED